APLGPLLVADLLVLASLLVSRAAGCCCPLLPVMTPVTPVTTPTTPPIAPPKTPPTGPAARLPSRAPCSTPLTSPCAATIRGPLMMNARTHTPSKPHSLQRTPSFDIG